MHYFHIASNHPPFYNTALAVITQHYPEAATEQSFDLDSMVWKLENHKTDLLLLDLRISAGPSLFGLIMVNEKFPHIPVAVISPAEETQQANCMIEQCPSLCRCAQIAETSTAYCTLQHGACAYLPTAHSQKTLHDAICAVLDGHQWVPEEFRGNWNSAPIAHDEKILAAKIATLTPQQYRVLCHLRKGGLNKQIAHKLNVTESTIKTHVSAIFRKLGVYSRTQAAHMLRDTH